MNMSRVIGPVVAGALLAGAGSHFVFLLNALLSVIAFTLIMRWRSQRRVSALPGERFVGAMRVGLQHVMQSPRMRDVLMRIFLFFLQSTSLTALLPLVARGSHSGDAGTFTLLLAAMGGGAIVAALSFSRLARARGSRPVRGAGHGRARADGRDGRARAEPVDRGAGDGGRRHGLDRRPRTR